MTRYIFILFILCLVSCDSTEIRIKAKERSYTYINKTEAPYFTEIQDVYVSAYSNLFLMDGSRKVFYTVILSLRNISFTDTLHFNRISYIDSKGNILRDLMTDSLLVLHPMESFEYIVEQTENDGGAGANFIVSYGKDPELKNKPIIEAVMSGTISNLGFAFKTDGVEINR